MMWPVGWELLVTLSNMQRVMQSPQRRVRHVIWPSLQNTCLLRSWLQRHALQTLLAPEDQDSSGTSPGVHWPGCCIASDSAGLVSPPMAGDQPPVSRGHLTVPMMQYQARLCTGPVSADQPSCRPPPQLSTGSMLHVSQIFWGTRW